MSRQYSLANRLTRYVTMGFAAVWFLALIATALVLRSEQEELADATIQHAAQVFLPAIASDFKQRRADQSALPITTQGTPRFDPDGRIGEIDDALVYRMLDRSGNMLVQSLAPPETVYPDSYARGYTATPTHKFYTTASNSDGFMMQVGDLRQERVESYLDSFLALSIPMLAILPLAWLLVGWIGRRSLAPIERLRDEIAQRGDARLDPIDATDQPTELRAITSTLNGFMIRLAQALDGERAFATSAAHELRTPVAIALAQVQRMRAELPETQMGEAGEKRLIAIEEALQRMTRLVIRLLQLARADAGIGMSDTSQDIRALLEVILEDSRRDPSRAHRLRIDLPSGPVLSSIDPDGLAMLVGNLIDNAFQHAPQNAFIDVALSPTGQISVVNDGPIIAAQDLANLTKRFHRGSASSNGFGLGLYIADTIAKHTGGQLKLYSPALGRERGFHASFQPMLAKTPSPKT